MEVEVEVVVEDDEGSLLENYAAGVLCGEKGDVGSRSRRCKQIFWCNMRLNAAGVLTEEKGDVGGRSSSFSRYILV